MKKLSILIASIPERHQKLTELYSKLEIQMKPNVEILVLTDNRSMTIGRKRQLLNMIANGEYIVHVDDDDRVSDDFISSLLEAIEKNPNVDVITFIVDVSIDNNPFKPCIYNPSFSTNLNFNDHYQRIPNTRCCFRRRVALCEDIPDIMFGEDDAWGSAIQRHISTHHHIPKTLYYYEASTNKPSNWFQPV